MTGRDIPDEFRRDGQAYTATVTMIRLLYGSHPTEGVKRIEVFQQFGWLGYDVHVYDAHIDYLKWLNSNLTQIGHIFDPIIIRRWRLVNNLILSSYGDEEWLRREGLPLAAMAGFPLFEEVARRTSGFWDEDGKLVTDPPEEVAFRTLDDDGGWRPRTGYKESKRIVELAHKLILMEWSLPEAFRNSLAKLNEIVDHPAVAGDDQPDANLYERLQYSRDVRSHGLRWEGIDAWWITFLLALLYFRLPPYSRPGTPVLEGQEEE